MTKKKLPGTKMSYNTFPRVKPKWNCKHDWHLQGLSAVPTCSKCKGEVFPATAEYTMAFIEARMKSSRGREKFNAPQGRRQDA
jgi:hypothetical protein